MAVAVQRPVPSTYTPRSGGNHTTFVSRHVQLPLSDITEYLRKKDLEYRVAGSQVNVKRCPFCHDTRGQIDNMWKLYFGAESGGAYFCHRCGSNGSWYDFKRRVGGVEMTGLDAAALERSSSGSTRAGEHDTPGKPMPNQRLARAYAGQLMSHPGKARVREFLTGKAPGQRGIDRAVLLKYGVGSAVYSFPTEHGYREADCVTFPWHALRTEMSTEEFTELLAGTEADSGAGGQPVDSVITRLKVRAVDNKAWQRLDPAGGRWGLFGWHTVPPDATEVVLTEGEFDALAVYQATGVPAVSLPNGCRSLPVDVLPMLERFTTIYLWMDNDAPGQEGAAKFARKLGERRVRIVRPPADDAAPAKDANEALLAGKDLAALLAAARPLQRDEILHFSDLRESVLHEIMNPMEFVGTPLESFPRLTEIVKGFRQGELSVFTGGTGAGKTTVLSQISLDLARRGVSTLWGSFEVRNTRLVKKMLQQFGGRPPEALAGDAPALSALMDRFEALPLCFMGFHGGTDVDEVLEAMEYAVYVNDVSHIILDNLQFMLSRSATSAKRGGMAQWDKFDAQDIAMEKFRKFATERNVHITLVIHPRKEDDEKQRLSLTSVFGSAKMTQEADLVLILQRVAGERKLIEVRKNRFDGAVGSVPLYFDRDSGCLRESQAAQQRP
ncbi:mitochondrial helicase twinkle [Tribonema minus]|uniref:Mitochondrial helicase twinkle n=1 Tax=Tribonema minus TaxID=303371 RepID=A0A835ZLV9_9STRA|nr:mitochondrial helicase twinkle [Tribonema minus]